LNPKNNEPKKIHNYIGTYRASGRIAGSEWLCCQKNAEARHLHCQPALPGLWQIQGLFVATETKDRLIQRYE